MSILNRLTDVLATGQPVALCTIVRTTGSVPRQAGTKMLVFPDGRMEGTVGGGEVEARVRDEAVAALQDGRIRNLDYSLTDPGRGDPGVCGGTVEVFVEPIQPAATLLIIGAGHVGRALAALGALLGYRILVSDDRAELCTPENIPQAEAFYPIAMGQLPEQITLNPQTYMVLTTRNAEIDVAGLPALLATQTAFVGVIGSRRRWQTARKAMQAAGVPKKQLDRVHSPVGLELNAETPEEIALSILAEITMLRRGGDGKPMKSP